MKTSPNYAIPYPESPDHTRTWEYWRDQALALDTVLKTKFVEYAANGAAAISAGGVARPLPFATQANIIGVPFANVEFASIAVAFAASRFTQPPMVMVTSTNQALISAAMNVTAAGFSASLMHKVEANLTATYNAYWLATQMLPTSGAGLSADPQTVDDDAVPVVMTCHTNGCDNANLPITLMVGPDIAGAICGVCGQPITDHVPA